MQGLQAFCVRSNWNGGDVMKKKAKKIFQWSWVCVNVCVCVHVCVFWGMKYSIEVLGNVTQNLFSSLSLLFLKIEGTLTIYLHVDWQIQIIQNFAATNDLDKTSIHITKRFGEVTTQANLSVDNENKRCDKKVMIFRGCMVCVDKKIAVNWRKSCWADKSIHQPLQGKRLYQISIRITSKSSDNGKT